MKIRLICIGATDQGQVLQLMKNYEDRMPQYINYERIELPDVKNRKSLSQEQQLLAEKSLFIKKITPGATVILLDEKGKEYTSKGFARWIQKKMNEATRELCFLVGGPYGFHESVKNQYPEQIALSKMTFTHQMVRLFMVEQVYRAFSILEGKPYHHE